MSIFETIYIYSFINEIFGKFELKQIFKNKENNPIELSIGIPVVEGMYLNKIKVKIDNKEYISEIYYKEKAKEKFSDSISEGNNAVYCFYDKDNSCYKIHISRLEENSIFEIESTFFYLVSFRDNKYSFSLFKIYPSDYYKEKRIKANIKLKTISKILNINSSNFDKNKDKIIIKFLSDNELNIHYVKMDRNITSTINNIDALKEGENFDNILFYFNTENQGKDNNLFYQFDHILNKKTYVLRINKNNHDKLNIFSNQQEQIFYFIINKIEINYIYYCFILPNNISYKNILNSEINYILFEFNPGNELNKALMSMYLNIYENNISNELRMAKEYQILSKNSYLFIKIINDNIINDLNKKFINIPSRIKNYPYYYQKSNIYDGHGEGDFIDFTDFGGAGSKNINNFDLLNDNNNEEKIKLNSNKFLLKYNFKNNEKTKKICPKCNQNLTREHITNKCPKYNKWRKKSLRKIKNLYKLYEMEMPQYDLE